MHSHAITYTESSDIVQLRNDVASLIRRVCLGFVEVPVHKRYIGDAYATLRSLLDPDTPQQLTRLALFAYHLREAMGSRNPADLIDTTPFWRLIDSISFLGDSVPGRWPYCTSSDHQRYLAWSRQYAESLGCVVD